MSENALQIVTKARKALALARTVDDFKEIRDQGHAALKYLKSKRDMGVDARNDVSEIVILAERGIGQMLKKLPKNKGTAGKGRPKLGGNTVLPPNGAPTYKDLGFNKMQANRLQMVADLPDKVLSKAAAIAKWFLIDLSIFRYHMICNLETLRHGRIPNGDGTHFAWYDITSFPSEPPLLIAASHALVAR